MPRTPNYKSPEQQEDYEAQQISSASLSGRKKENGRSKLETFMPKGTHNWVRSVGFHFLDNG